MARTAEATVTLSLVDKISGPIKRITARLNALGKRVGLGKEIDRVGAAIGRLQGKIGELGPALMRTGTRFAAFGALAVAGVTGAITAVGGLTSKVMEASREFGKLAQVAGLPTVDFQAGSFAVGTYGISPDKYADQLKDWQDKIGEYNATGGGEMKEVFADPRMKKAGFTPKSLKGKSPDQQVAAFFAAMEKANLPQNERIFYAEKINDLSMLQDAFSNNGEEYNRLKQDYLKSGAAMGESVKKLSHEWFVASARMSARFTGLQRLIGVRFAPFFIKALDQITAKLDAAAPQIRNWIDGIAESFSRFLDDLFNPASRLRQTIDGIVTAVRDFFVAVDEKSGETGFQKTVRQIGEAVSMVTTAFGKFSDMVGGPANAAMLLIAGWVLAPTALAIGGLTLSLLGLGKALGGIAVASIAGITNALTGLGGGAVEKAMTAVGSANGSLYGKAFALAAQAAILAGVALITAELLQYFDPKGNLGGLTTNWDNAIRKRLGLEAKDTGITPGELWQGGKNWWNGTAGDGGDGKPTPGIANPGAVIGGMIKPPEVTVTPNITVEMPKPPEIVVPEIKTPDVYRPHLDIPKLAPPVFRDYGAPNPAKAGGGTDAVDPQMIQTNSNNQTTVTITAPITITAKTDADPSAIGAAVRRELDGVAKRAASAQNSSLSD